MVAGSEVSREADPAGDYPDRLARWPWIAGTILSLLGLGVSIYLTYEHYTGSTSLSCPASSTTGFSVFGLFSIPIDCFKVTTSIYSTFLGVPVAVLGLVFFVVMVALQSPWSWRRPEPAVRAARIAWCVIGMATAFKLIYDEVHDLDAICLWCTTVHLITFLILVITVFGTVSVSDYFARDL